MLLSSEAPDQKICFPLELSLQKIVHAFICNYTDYCNSLFAGPPKTCLSSLQSLMTSYPSIFPLYSIPSLLMLPVASCRDPIQETALIRKNSTGFSSKISLQPIASVFCLLMP